MGTDSHKISESPLWGMRLQAQHSTLHSALRRYRGVHRVSHLCPHPLDFSTLFISNATLTRCTLAHMHGSTSTWS